MYKDGEEAEASPRNDKSAYDGGDTNRDSDGIFLKWFLGLFYLPRKRSNDDPTTEPLKNPALPQYYGDDAGD